VKTFVRLVVTLGLIAVLGTAALSANAQVSETMTISIKDGSLKDHGCDSTVWEIIINQIGSVEQAPDHITVEWLNGAKEDVNRFSFTGGAAHYRTTSNLGSYITEATAEIYVGWDGQFVLSHGPCGEITPTPVVTTVVSTTETPTETETVTPTNTITPTKTETQTETVTVTPTETVTITETPTGTITQTPSTVTPTSTPEETGTPVVTITDIPPADPTPTEPSLGGEVPERADNIWLYVLVLVTAAAVIIKKIM